MCHPEGIHGSIPYILPARMIHYLLSLTDRLLTKDCVSCHPRLWTFAP